MDSLGQVKTYKNLTLTRRHKLEEEEISVFMLSDKILLTYYFIIEQEPLREKAGIYTPVLGLF